MRKPKIPQHLKPNNYAPHIYDGISAAECKGPAKIYAGPLYQGRLPWPGDIARFYEGKL